MSNSESEKKNRKYFFRCLRCQKILEGGMNRIEAITMHVLAEHPELLPGGGRKHYTAGASSVETQENRLIAFKGEADAQKSQGEETLKKQSKANSSSYRETLENWKASGGELLCPRCLLLQEPKMKSHKERLCSCLRGDKFLKIIRFLCCLPHDFFDSDTYDLYCSHCNAFLGVYNTMNKTVKPNPRFLDHTD